MSVFSVHSSANDVEAVMGAVAGTLRQWEGGSALPLDFSLIQGRGKHLTQQAHQLQFQWNIDGNTIIHSTRPGVGTGIIRFQVLVRRLTWWFLEPILQQIRLFQMNTARVAEGLAQNQEALMARLTTASREDWAGRIEALESRVQALQGRVAEREDGDAG